MNRIALTAVAFASLTTVAAAAEFDVCDAGCDYTTIQAAIDGSADGDKIWIAAGTYAESLTVDHHVILAAETRDLRTVVVEGDGTQPVLTVTQDGFAKVGRIDFTDGGGDLGGIVNAGVLQLSKSHVMHHDAQFGAILNLGDLRLRRNSLVGYSHGQSMAGGITNYGDALIEGTTIIGNQGHLGGGIANVGGTVTVRNSAVRLNHAEQLGGGWSNHDWHGTVAFEATSTLSDNTTNYGLYEGCYDVHGDPACTQ